MGCCAEALMVVLCKGSDDHHFVIGSPCCPVYVEALTIPGLDVYCVRDTRRTTCEV